MKKETFGLFLGLEEERGRKPAGVMEFMNPKAILQPVSGFDN
ncbi:hypothetical protein [Peribacillus saganii]|nr:hypothetical protein [Peribacillus saganii]